MNSKLFIAHAVIFLLLIFNVSVKGQEFSAGVDIAAPLGDLAKGFGTGLGLSVRYENEFGKRMSWMVDGGFLSFGAKNSGTAVSMIPVQGGLKYYLQDEINGFYLMGQLGFHFLSGGHKTETDFSLAPGIGYDISNFDFSLKYQTINSSLGNFDYVAFRAAYIFPNRRR